MYAQIKYDFAKWSLIIISYAGILLSVSKTHNILVTMIGSLYLALLISVVKSPLIKHILLRAMLFFKGRIPLRLRTFMNKMSESGLMEKDGGQWRFRHQMIQDRLAGKEI